MKMEDPTGKIPIRKNRGGLLVSILRITIDSFLRALNIFVIFRSGKALGEQVSMTAAVGFMRKEYGYRIVVVSSYPNIFEYNDNVFLNVGIETKPYLIKRLASFIAHIGCKRFVTYLYSPETFGTHHQRHEEFLLETRKPLHLVQVHTAHFAKGMTRDKIRPEIFFSNVEIEINRKRSDWPRPPYAIIHSQGKSSYTPNKSWDVEKFQQVIKDMPSICWLQVGFPEEQSLDGVIDFRGKTSFRELALLIRDSDFVVCQEGLYNHLAAAVGTRAITIFSGFHPPDIATYSTTIPISLNPQVSCAPCWLLTPCPVHGKPCTSQISPGAVVEAINSLKRDSAG